MRRESACVAFVFFLVCCTAVFPASGKQLEAMMPEALNREYKKARTEYRELEDRLEEVKKDILAIDLQDPDAKTDPAGSPLIANRRKLLAKQTDLTKRLERKEMELRYVKRVLKTKRREYRSTN